MFLCIDLGSTSFKASLYDSELNVQGKGSAYLNYDQLSERVEFSPDAAFATVESAVRQALESARLTPQEVTAVAVTSQAQTFALRTKSSFSTPFISWQDSRGESIAASMKTDPAFAKFGEHSSFNEPVGGLMICLLRKVLEEHPALRGADVVPLPSHVIEQLTGRLVLDENLAAMTGLWSIPDKKWNSDYLNRLDIIAAQLPLVGALPFFARAAQSGNFLNLTAGCPVYSAGNDQTAGGYAAELERDGGILITLGSAQVVYQWTRELVSPGPGIIRGIYPGGGYYQTSADMYGGNLIMRAIKHLELDGFDDFFEQAETGFTGKVDVPEAVPGAGRLTWSDDSASSESKCAAVIKFLSKRMAGMVGQLRKDVQPVYLTGDGGARRETWRKCLERELGYKLTLRSAAPDRGAARMMECICRTGGRAKLKQQSHTYSVADSYML